MGNSGILADRVIIVTGASSGIGAEVTRVLAREGGATVVATARRSDRLASLAREDSRVIPWTCDVTDGAAREQLVAGVLDQFGRVDTLINNAGATNIAPATEESIEDFRRILEVNLVAPFALSRQVAQHMLAREDGIIINVSSIVGLVGLGRMPQAAYAAAKAGLINLTRELSAQWARKGIRVNAIAPGWFETEMTEGLFDNSKGHEWVGSLTPMGRAGRLSELSGALLYLADPRNSYTTGIVIPVDGGWTAV
jgi:NAD(P)-dependent dehydrogenase (short-subunit alcohol dehydrogenase family)